MASFQRQQRPRTHSRDKPPEGGWPRKPRIGKDHDRWFRVAMRVENNKTVADITKNIKIIEGYKEKYEENDDYTEADEAFNCICYLEQLLNIYKQREGPSETPKQRRRREEQRSKEKFRKYVESQEELDEPDLDYFDGGHQDNLDFIRRNGIEFGTAPGFDRNSPGMVQQLICAYQELCPPSSQPGGRYK